MVKITITLQKEIYTENGVEKNETSYTSAVHKDLICKIYYIQSSLCDKNIDLTGQHVCLCRAHLRKRVVIVPNLEITFLTLVIVGDIIITSAAVQFANLILI